MLVVYFNLCFDKVCKDTGKNNSIISCGHFVIEKGYKINNFYFIKIQILLCNII